MSTAAVLFDMDGVLTDSEPVINAAAIAGLREYGVQAQPSDFEPFVGMGEDRYIGGVAARYGLRYEPAMKRRVYEIYLELAPSRVRAFPGAVALVRRLAAAGIPRAVASSADRIKVEASLAAIGLRLDEFGAIITAEDVAARKPAPDIFLTAAARLEIAPATCCVIEDALSGVQAARAAGMRCVAVTTSFPAARLIEAGAHAVRDSLTDIGPAELGLAAGKLAAGKLAANFGL